MPNETPSAARVGAGRWAAVAGLVVALLLLGAYDGPILVVLTKLWQQALAATGLRQQAEVLQHGINGGVTKRRLPAVAAYAAVYLGTCLLLLRLLLPAPAQWRLVLRLYAGLLAVYVGVVLLGKFGGDAPWAYKLSRQLLDFVISPLPVAGLYVLLRASFGPSVRP